MDLSFDEQAVLRQLNLEQSASELQQRIIIRVRQIAAERLQHRFTAAMTEDDLKKVTAMSDDAAAQAWLVRRFPEYREWFLEDLQTTVDFMAAQSATVASALRSRPQ